MAVQNEQFNAAASNRNLVFKPSKHISLHQDEAPRNKEARSPKLSIQGTKSFDQQVKRLIAESTHGSSKAALGKQILQDQQLLRQSLAQPRKVNSDLPSLGYSSILMPQEKSVADAVTKFIEVSSHKAPLPAVRTHYTSTGKKLHDTSIQVVLAEKKGQEESVTNLNILSRRLKNVPSMNRPASPTLGGRLRLKSNERSKGTSTVAILPFSRSKLNFQDGSKVGVAGKTSGSKISAQLLSPAELSKLTSIGRSDSRMKQVGNSAPIFSGGSQITQSALKLHSGSYSKYPQLKTTSKLVVEESVRETKREEAKTSDEKKKIVVTKMQPEIQHISRTYQSARSSFKGEYSSLRGKHNKEPWLKSDPRMSFFLKPKRGSYQKSIQVTSGETGGGTLESRSQMRQDESKQLQRTESMLKEMAKYCHCPDLEVVGEVEMSEMQVNFEEFRQSTENPTGKRSKIKSVTRSPFERKDRAARAAFAKELEQIEIAEIEKKQRLKPRKIKKELKTGGVYETVKSICQIPDSFTDSLRGHPSCPSAITGASPPISLGSNHTGTDGSQSKNSSEDKIQLRKETSMGSRTTPGRVTRDDAFHEIELSEDSETSYNKLSVGTPSASSCELISTSSDISLRVNLEESYSPNTKKRRKLINAPFVHYHNKANAEMILAEGRSKAKILDTNLEGVIIERIATEFGEWAKENGVKPEAVEKDVIKELFQFGTMDTAANSIAVEIKELIIVPDTITGGIYPELEERAAMYRQILFDECSYWRTERSMAFGKPDPKPYKRPQNAPLPAWTKSGFVPQPLATGEQLYQTLIDNDSTMLERYVLWMVENPKHYRPPYLMKCGYFQRIVDKHGGSEEAIRQKTAAMKLLAAKAGKSMAGLNIGMQSDLKKLKEMSEAGKKPKNQE